MTDSAPPDRRTAPLTIRRGMPDDADRLTAFAERVFVDTFGPDNSPADMATYIAIAFTTDAQRRELTDADRTVLLAESDGELAAYALLRAGSREPCVPSERTLEVERFYVGGAWHGTGVAHRLMDAVLDVARAHGADTVWLGVWERNARAIRFYEKRGFRDVGAHPFVLGSDVQTDRVMARTLGDA